MKQNWFSEASFGLFIHWGIYSIPSKDCRHLYSNAGFCMFDSPDTDFKITDSFLPAERVRILGETGSWMKYASTSIHGAGIILKTEIDFSFIWHVRLWKTSFCLKEMGGLRTADI